MNKKFRLISLIFFSVFSAPVYALDFLCPVLDGTSVNVPYQDTDDKFQRTMQVDVMSGCWPVTNTKPGKPITVAVMQAPPLDYSCAGVINKTQFKNFYCSNAINVTQYIRYPNSSVINSPNQKFGYSVGDINFVFPQKTLK